MSEHKDIYYSYWESFKKGEERAFDFLYREFFASMSYYAYRTIQHAHHAEDIVQDCFVSLWNRRNELSHITDIKSYLYRAIKNQCLKYLEKANNTVHSIKEDALPPIDQLIFTAEIARELYRLIDTLTPSMQQVIRLYYLEGKDYKEIGKMLNLDPESVRKQKYRALVALRKNRGLLKIVRSDG